MDKINIEIKARCSDPDNIRRILVGRHADFRGLDHQCDTYFNVQHGRLKLRQGNIENTLIFYDRPDQAGPKQSNVSLYQVQPAEQSEDLLRTLSNSNGILVQVKKHREIYFIDNIKFHIDVVDELGSFVEIEAIGDKNHKNREKLLQQCQEYMKLFGISEQDLVNCSYSDMIRKIEQDQN